MWSLSTYSNHFLCPGSIWARGKHSRMDGLLRAPESPHSLSRPSPVPRCPTAATNPGAAFGTPRTLPPSQGISSQEDRRRFPAGICGFTEARGDETSPTGDAAATGEPDLF